MRQLVAPPVKVHRPTVQTAFDAVFGLQTMRRMHGASLTTTDWAGDTRTMHYKIGTLPVITNQRVIRHHDARMEVRHATMFDKYDGLDVSTTFMLTQEDNGDVFLGGNVRIDATGVVYPLKSVIENVAEGQAETELRWFGRCLAEEGIAEGDWLTEEFVM